MTEHKLKVYKKEYTVILTPDLTENGFTVTVDGIPECITQGNDEKQAMKNAKDCILEYLAGVRNAEKLSKMKTKARYIHCRNVWKAKQKIADDSKTIMQLAYQEWQSELEKEKTEFDELSQCAHDDEEITE